MALLSSHKATRVWLMSLQSLLTLSFMVNDLFLVLWRSDSHFLLSSTAPLRVEARRSKHTGANLVATFYSADIRRSLDIPISTQQIRGGSNDTSENFATKSRQRHRRLAMDRITMAPTTQPGDTDVPTFEPAVTSSPTQASTDATLSPTSVDTIEPSPVFFDQPTEAPTTMPTIVIPPTISPTAQPSQTPSVQFLVPEIPSNIPSLGPTLLPSVPPSNSPSKSATPTTAPIVSAIPTILVTMRPSSQPPSTSSPVISIDTPMPSISNSMTGTTRPVPLPTMAPTAIVAFALANFNMLVEIPSNQSSTFRVQGFTATLTSVLLDEMRATQSPTTADLLSLSLQLRNPADFPDSVRHRRRSLQAESQSTVLNMEYSGLAVYESESSEFLPTEADVHSQQIEILSDTETLQRNIEETVSSVPDLEFGVDTFQITSVVFPDEPTAAPREPDSDPEVGVIIGAVIGGVAVLGFFLIAMAMRRSTKMSSDTDVEVASTSEVVDRANASVMPPSTHGSSWVPGKRLADDHDSTMQPAVPFDADESVITVQTLLNTSGPALLPSDRLQSYTDELGVDMVDSGLALEFSSPNDNRVSQVESLLRSLSERGTAISPMSHPATGVAAVAAVVTSGALANKSFDSEDGLPKYTLGSFNTPKSSGKQHHSPQSIQLFDGQQRDVQTSFQFQGNPSFDNESVAENTAGGDASVYTMEGYSMTSDAVVPRLTNTQSGVQNVVSAGSMSMLSDDKLDTSTDDNENEAAMFYRGPTLDSSDTANTPSTATKPGN
jgi:hypothetical protein